MSAFAKSGRSDLTEIAKMTGRLRPIADIDWPRNRGIVSLFHIRVQSLKFVKSAPKFALRNRHIDLR